MRYLDWLMSQPYDREHPPLLKDVEEFFETHGIKMVTTKTGEDCTAFAIPFFTGWLLARLTGEPPKRVKERNL